MSNPDSETGSCTDDDQRSCDDSTVFYSIKESGSYDEFRFELEEIKVVCNGGVGKDCRICHMGLDDDESPGVGIELGCSCKDDLAVAHKGCADHWFAIKGNKTCEICNSVARNVTVQNDQQPEALQQQQEEGNDIAVAIPSPAASDTRSCWQGHRFLNFLLGCMVFAFVVSWLFHFNVSS